VKRSPQIRAASLAALAALIAALSAGCSAGKITVPRYVLSYGVGNYRPVTTDSGDLSTPAPDAIAIRDLLVSEGYADGYSDYHVGARTDTAVTHDQIRSDILGLSSLESDAIVVIFYSSHGTYAPPGNGSGYEGAYLVPYDAVDASGNLTTATAVYLISPSELSSWISQSGKRNVIVIINACYSGGFVDSGSSTDIAPQNYGPNDWGTTPSGVWTALGKFGDLLSKNASESGKPGPIVISAAGTNESSYETTDPYYEGHGVFPFFILKAATSGDADGDGFVTTTEAYQYAVSGIKLNWNMYFQSYYNPTVGYDGNQGFYVYPDFMPHISGGSRDLVLFSK
jgi:hypothetical protein